MIDLKFKCFTFVGAKKIHRGKTFRKGTALEVKYRRWLPPRLFLGGVVFGIFKGGVPCIKVELCEFFLSAFFLVVGFWFSNSGRDFDFAMPKHGSAIAEKSRRAHTKFQFGIVGYTKLKFGSVIIP